MRNRKGKRQMTEGKFIEFEKNFGRYLQKAGIKRLKFEDLKDVSVETALKVIEVGIELEKMARARDRPSIEGQGVENL